MSATTSPDSIRHSVEFSTLSTKNGPLNAVTGGVMALLSSGRLASPPNKNLLPHTIFGHHETCQVLDMAEEALRLTRETLDRTQDQYNKTTTTTQSNIDTPTTVSPTASPHRKEHRMPATTTAAATTSTTPGVRLNKFVRRLHDMLLAEKDSGIVEWRRGLLVLHNTDAFAKQILPKYFNTRNFKTFRRQLNYYGFVHVRSFSTTGTSTTALWVNRDLAQTAGVDISSFSSSSSSDVSSVLLLRRVEPNESAKTTEGRRVRKELAIHTVEEDLGISPKTLQMEQIRSLAHRYDDVSSATETSKPIPSVIRFPRTVSASDSSSNSDGGGVSQQPHRRRVSSLDSVTAATASNMPMTTLYNVPSRVTEAASCSSDEESAANLLLNLSKLT